MKKIGMGGAAAVGASVVISSPAFAYDLPNQTSKPTFTVPPIVNVTTNSVTISQASAGVGSCNLSANSQSPVGVIQDFLTTSFTTATTGAILVITSQSTTQVTVQKRTSGGIPTPFVTGDQSTFDATVRYTCTYVGDTRFRDVVNGYTATNGSVV